MADELEQARLAYERGRELLNAGDIAGAITQFEASVAAYPHFKALELLGEAWLLRGEPLRAIVPLAAATTLNRQVRAPSLLAEALLAAGERLRAYEAAELALQRDPSNKKALAIAAATEPDYRRHHEE